MSSPCEVQRQVLPYPWLSAVHQSHLHDLSNPPEPSLPPDMPRAAETQSPFAPGQQQQVPAGLGWAARPLLRLPRLLPPPLPPSVRPSVRPSLPAGPAGG